MSSLVFTSKILYLTKNNLSNKQHGIYQSCYIDYSVGAYLFLRMEYKDTLIDPYESIKPTI